jgi:hypothetical protein
MSRSSEKMGTWSEEASFGAERHASDPRKRPAGRGVASPAAPLTGQEFEALSGNVHRRAMASAAIVNRTHRVVRQRAKTIQDRRMMMRSLWIPLTVCAGLFGAVLFAVWNVLEQYEISVDALPDLSQQMMVLMMWCLPLSLIVLTVVWLSRSGSKTDGNWR